MAPPRAPTRSARARSSNNKCLAEIPARRPCCWVTDLCEGWLDTLSVAGYRLRHKGTRCDAVMRCVSNEMVAETNPQPGLAFGPA